MALACAVTITNTQAKAMLLRFKKSKNIFETC